MRGYFTPTPAPDNGQDRRGAHRRWRGQRAAAHAPRAQQSPGATSRAPGPGVEVGASRDCGPQHCPPPCSLRTRHGPAGRPRRVRGGRRGWSSRRGGPGGWPDGSRHSRRADAPGQHSRADPQRLRRRACCDPCGGARTGWSGQRGCACAGGNRAPCDGDGCSAGTYACSRQLSPMQDQIVISGMPTPGARGEGQHFGWHRPPTHDPGWGWTSWTCGTGRHRVRPSHGTRCARTGSNRPTLNLWMTG